MMGRSGSPRVWWAGARSPSSHTAPTPCHARLVPSASRGAGAWGGLDGLERGRSRGASALASPSQNT